MKISLPGILTVCMLFMYSANTFSQDSTRPVIPSLPPDSTTPVSPVKVLPKDSIRHVSDSVPTNTKTQLLVPVQQDSALNPQTHISRDSTQRKSPNAHSNFNRSGLTGGRGNGRQSPAIG